MQAEVRVKSERKGQESHRTYHPDGDEFDGEYWGEADGEPHVEYPHEVLGACEADDGQTGGLQQEHGHPREKESRHRSPPCLPY